MRGPDANTMLSRALVALAGNAGCAIEIITIESTAWASATFGGARHRLVVRSDDAAFADWLSCLSEAEFALNGHLVADIAVDSLRRDDRRYVAQIAALTVAEA